MNPNEKKIAAALAGTYLALTDGAHVRYGNHLCGPGHARCGWARYSAAGDCVWLGRSVEEVLAQTCGATADGVTGY